MSGIERRCEITKNPCGTDTRAAGDWCKCSECQTWTLERELLEQEVRSLSKHLPVSAPAQETLQAPCAGACGTVVTYAPPKLRPSDHERIFCVPCATRMSGGSPPPDGVTFARAGRHPAHRAAQLIADRFTKRFGRAPSAEAFQAYEAQMLTWPEGQREQLAQVADAIERYRLANPSVWEMVYPIPPKDDLEGLRDIAKKLGQTLGRQDAEKG